MTDVAVGARVVMTFLPRCGRCAGCRTDGRLPCEIGTAANNGQMIAEVQAGAKASDVFSELAARMIGRPETRRVRGNLFEPLLSRLSRRKAS